ncbi:single-stranded DNA-binding protein [Streptomyces griseoloalbus]|uniref:Single-stranded DNA-binding protein n=1 Tax=Streptomyces griseoloalbus TaxID=67303 RepID=A0A7W8BRV8_9ACTN|nr:single-stranded DNA-binding protein [Streptomyces albaduncus]MBB5128469.1 single-strand DNA-binding protein [Streptomyces albaduncus]GGW68127.1 single-stranded DNA-binding protein [Streptomyces albaduncus]
MAGETLITLQGNLTADPELRFTPSGHAVAQFTVASTPRTYDKSTNEWKDGDPLFMRCSAWRQLAENVAESLTRGHAVIVIGRLKQRSYEDKEGVKRTVMEVEAENVGPSLLRATARPEKTTGQRNTSQQPSSGYGAQQPSSGYGQQQPQQDPWATGQQQPQQRSYSDEPPF